MYVLQPWMLSSSAHFTDTKHPHPHIHILNTHTHTHINIPTLTPSQAYTRFARTHSLAPPHTHTHRRILAPLAHAHARLSGYFAAVRRHKSRPEMARFPPCCLFSSGAPRPAHCSERLRHPVSRHHRPPTLARAHLNIDTFKIIHLHNTYQHPHGNSTTQ